MIDVYTVDIESLRVKEAFRGKAESWAKGFVAGNNAVDQGHFSTEAEIYSRIGLWDCPDNLCGTFCTNSLSSVGRKHDLVTADNQWSFVVGVRESVEANAILIGAQNV